MTGRPRSAAFPRTYPCVVVSVTDGDTARCFLDRGGNDWWLIGVRLAAMGTGLAARERADPGGPEARAYLAGLLASMTPPTVAAMLTPRWQGTCASLAWDKYADRVVGRLYPPGSAFDVGTQMIRDGYAAPWDGRGPQPKPPWPIPERTS